jgi:hypothetical protein
MDDFDFDEYSVNSGKGARLIMLFKPEYAAELAFLGDRMKRAIQQKARRGNVTRE